MISEKQLIQACQKGKSDSQFELVKRYSAVLMAVCMRYAKDESTAKDILQETFIRIFKYIGRYNYSGSFEGWMKRIAVRQALTWIKKSHKKEEVFVHQYVETATSADVYGYFDFEEITKIINTLPIGFRTIFNLNVIEGYSHKEIAELLEVSESTSRSQLARARKMLQKKLQNTQNYKSA